MIFPDILQLVKLLLLLNWLWNLLETFRHEFICCEKYLLINLIPMIELWMTLNQIMVRMGNACTCCRSLYRWVTHPIYTQLLINSNSKFILSFQLSKHLLHSVLTLCEFSQISELLIKCFRKCPKSC